MTVWLRWLVAGCCPGRAGQIGAGMRRSPVLAALVVGVLLAGCGHSAEAERVAYLRAVGQRGVQAHDQLRSQGAGIDPPRCSQVYASLSRDHGLPLDHSGTASLGWYQQVEATFVDSCVAGQLLEALVGQGTLP